MSKCLINKLQDIKVSISKTNTNLSYLLHMTSATATTADTNAATTPGAASGMK